MIQEIEAWLQGPVYWDGVELYEKYGSSDMLKRMFAGSGDSFNKKKLASELTIILEEARAKQAITPAAEEPAEIKELRTQANSLMDQRSALKERARIIIAGGVKEGPELREIAHSLAFGIKSQLDGIFGRIRYCQLNGSLPDPGPVALLTVADMVKRRNTLRTYLSRGGKPEKLEKWKSEAFELDLKIKQMEGQ